MAVIKPSRSFAGSAMNSGDMGRYILPEIPVATFNKNNNKEGAWLYFLPAYKLDNAGNGVWFKVIQVRDNFGDKFKDKYVVTDPANDPVSYFQKNFSLLYPDQAKVIETEENGRKQKKYPLYGRVTKRVVYNVAFCQNMAAGAHILDLPMFNGADQIEKYHNTKLVNGNQNGLICDPDRAVPVFIKLNDGGGSPWQIQPDASQAGALPAQLQDSEYLHNLDEIFTKKDTRELIQKLREMYHPSVFEECMNGFPGFTSVTVAPGFSPVVETRQAPQFSAPPAPPQPEVKKAPALTNVPKSKVPASGTRPQGNAPAVPTEMVASAVNPIMGMSEDEADAFLNDND